MDLLTDLLPAMRVKSAMYTRVEATAPWGLDFIPYHHTKFGLVLEGNAYINMEGEAAAVPLSVGDCYLLPRGDAFTLRASLDSPTQNFEDVWGQIEGRTLRYGGGGAACTLIGGRFIFDGPRYPAILDILPSLVHFKVSPSELRALRSTIELLASEIADPAMGSPLVVDRLADIFFVQTLRAYIGSANGREVKWLGAVADHQVGGALRVLHEQSAKDWTVEKLAAAVNMSRSAFALRFKTLVGAAPMEYLAHCRIQKATRLLRESEMSIGQIAATIGYESETSFNRVFKRQIGVPPGKFRVAHRNAPLSQPGSPLTE